MSETTREMCPTCDGIGHGWWYFMDQDERRRLPCLDCDGTGSFALAAEPTTTFWSVFWGTFRRKLRRDLTGPWHLTDPVLWIACVVAAVIVWHFGTGFAAGLALAIGLRHVWDVHKFAPVGRVGRGTTGGTDGQ
jgi:hypothetical protein